MSDFECEHKDDGTIVTRANPEDIVTETKRKTIEVYICPHPSCHQYFGSSTMGNLEEEFTGVKLEDRQAYEKAHGTPFRHSKAECPACRTEGRGRVARIRKRISVDVEVHGPAPVDLPAGSGIAHAP